MLPICTDRHICLKIETELTVALSIREIFKKERKQNPVCEANGGGSILLCTLKPGIHFFFLLKTTWKSPAKVLHLVLFGFQCGDDGSITGDKIG